MKRNVSHSIPFSSLTEEQIARIIKSLRYQAKVNMSMSRPIDAYRCEQFACTMAVNSK